MRIRTTGFETNTLFRERPDFSTLDHGGGESAAVVTWLAVEKETRRTSLSARHP
jgi:hypothetical protein